MQFDKQPRCMEIHGSVGNYSRKPAVGRPDRVALLMRRAAAAQDLANTCASARLPRPVPAVQARSPNAASQADHAPSPTVPVSSVSSVAMSAARSAALKSTSSRGPRTASRSASLTPIAPAERHMARPLHRRAGPPGNPHDDQFAHPRVQHAVVEEARQQAVERPCERRMLEQQPIGRAPGLPVVEAEFPAARGGRFAERQQCGRTEAPSTPSRPARPPADADLRLGRRRAVRWPGGSTPSSSGMRRVRSNWENIRQLPMAARSSMPCAGLPRMSRHSAIVSGRDGAGVQRLVHGGEHGAFRLAVAGEPPPVPDAQNVGFLHAQVPRDAPVLRPLVEGCPCARRCA